MISTTTISLSILVLALAAAVVLLIKTQKRETLIEMSTIKWIDFQEIEKRIDGIEEVLIISDKIDFPSTSNYSMMFPVIFNLYRGVKYSIILPEHFIKSAESEIKKTKEVYEEFLRELNPEIKDTDLQLSFFGRKTALKDYPFFLFKYTIEDNTGIIGYRGELAGEYFSDELIRVDSDISRTLYNFIYPIISSKNLDEEHSILRFPTIDANLNLIKLKNKEYVDLKQKFNKWSNSKIQSQK